MYRVLVIGLLVVVCFAAIVVGQSTFGSIVGVVHDKSQSVVPGASVQIKSLEDSSIRSTTADQDGAFEFLNLKPGKYALTAQAQGFAEAQIPSAELSARQSLRIDVVLTVASEVQTVEVSESALAINTENGVIGDQKVSSEITQLPLNFRAATTSPLAAMSTSANVEQDSQGNIAVGGATSNMVGYSVDGISTANIWTSAAGTNPYPSSEGIAELQVTAFNNNAEFSQVGDVTFTTKGGTNNFSPAPIRSPTTSTIRGATTPSALAWTCAGCVLPCRKSRRPRTTTVCSPLTRTSSREMPSETSCWACQTPRTSPSLVREMTRVDRKPGCMHRIPGG